MQRQFHAVKSPFKLQWIQLPWSFLVPRHRTHSWLIPLTISCDGRFKTPNQIFRWFELAELWAQWGQQFYTYRRWALPVLSNNTTARKYLLDDANFFVVVLKHFYTPFPSYSPRYCDALLDQDTAQHRQGQEVEGENPGQGLQGCPPACKGGDV